jgi:hypothetical protein
VIYYCDNCEAHKSFKPLRVHELRDEGYSSEFTFASCEACDHPVVFQRDDYGFGDGFNDDEYLRVYPPHERSITFHLPSIVRESYEEAIRCESHKIYIACVVMIGRTLEAVTNEHAPDERGMFNGLKKMAQDGTISQEIYQWADVLRWMRNVGAHPTAQKVSRVDASEALDFLQAILETVYYMRPKFNAMKARRDSRSNTSGVA